MVKEFVRDNKFPIALCTAIFSSIANIYSCRNVWVAVCFAFFSFAYSLILFIMLDFFRRRNNVLITTAGVLLAFVIVVLISGAVMNTVPYITFKWYMEPLEYSELYVGNIFSLILLIGYVLGSSAYYFTRIRYSRVFVFLICMSPFALYAKTFTDIPAIFMILITTLYFITLLENSSVQIKGKNLYLSCGALLLCVIMLASFLPKLDSAPYRKEFDEMITGVSIGVSGGGNFGEFADNSSNNTSDDDKTIVYYITGDVPLLIKSRVYNSYNSDKNVWEYYGDQNNGSNSWRRRTDRYYPEKLAQSVGLSTSSSKLRKYTVYSPFNAVQALYTAENTVGFSGNGFTDKDVYKNEFDEYFFPYDKRGIFTSYSVNWLETDFDAEFSERFGSIWRDGSDDLQDGALKYYDDAYSESTKYDDYLLSKGTLMNCYGSEAAYEKIQALAESITAGCNSAYEKAKAVEEYFSMGEYTYDLKFRPTDNSIENFILNTKRGACAKYATAMTLVMRHCGIAARYVEGFSVHRFDEEKQCYYVTVADSHAYVQVWIDGYGWVDFNPTSGTTDDVESEGNATFLIVGIIALTASLAAILFFVLRPVVREASFRKKAGSKRGKQQATMIYEKIVAELMKRTGESENTRTPSEICKLCYELLNYDITGFIGIYTEIAYSKDGSSENNLIEHYLGFMNALKSEKNRKKNT